jgi:hypothetical protein
LPSESKNLSYKNLFLGISVLILVFSFGTPIKAEAGIGSFLSSVFGVQKEEVSDEIDEIDLEELLAELDALGEGSD